MDFLTAIYSCPSDSTNEEMRKAREAGQIAAKEVGKKAQEKEGMTGCANLHAMHSCLLQPEMYCYSIVRLRYTCS